MTNLVGRQPPPPKSYANVAKQAGPRPPPKKSAGTKSPISKPIGSKPSAPPPSSLDAFPALPSPSSLTEPSAAATQSESQPASVDLTTSLRPSPQHAHSSSSLRTTRSEEPKASVPLVDCFKKPTHAMRSQSKSDNGNGIETDDSSTSTSSRRSTRGRPPGKKPRRDGADDEQGEENLL
nr:proline-rich receptor-like protein kinase PERK10 [Aedes albopictus]